MEGVDALLVIDSLDSAFRNFRPNEDGGLSSTKPVSGIDEPRLLNTFGGGLQNKLILLILMLAWYILNIDILEFLSSGS